MSFNNLNKLYVHFVQGGSFTVTITDPVAAATITDATPLITWAISAGIQAAYRVLIYSDALGTTVVYDSGWTASASMEHTVPAGALTTGQTYYLQVQASNTTGESGDSAIQEFSTDFATSVDVTGVTLTTFGDACRDPESLPMVRVRWTVVVPGVGEGFTSYLVKRKGQDESEWTVLAEITSVNTHQYDDYTPQSENTYQYAVVWVASSGGGTLVSTEQSNLFARIEFDYAWLHLVTRESTFIRVEAFDFSETVNLDLTPQRVWGQPAPVGVFGEGDFRTVAVTGAPDIFKRSNWEDLLDVIREQRDWSVVACYRHGKSRTKMFCMIMPPNRQMTVLGFTNAVELVETPYEESII